MRSSSKCCLLPRHRRQLHGEKWHEIPHSPKPRRPWSALKKTVRFHFLLSGFLLLVLIGGLGAWAATQKISGAVVGSGTIVVESNIKEVQHREGGIVKEIHVKNGDIVEAGTLLIRLDDTVMRANLAVVTKTADRVELLRKRG